VYGRVNNKLKTEFSNAEIEHLIAKVLDDTEEKDISKIGKNFYVSNDVHQIRLTINSNTFRLITVDALNRL
jgi:hypothetical protein